MTKRIIRLPEVKTKTELQKDPKNLTKNVNKSTYQILRECHKNLQNHLLANYPRIKILPYKKLQNDYFFMKMTEIR